MAPVSITKLAMLQQLRISEIAAIAARMRERDLNSLNKTIVQTRINTVNERWANIRKSHDDICLRPDSEQHAYMIENKYDAMQKIYEDTIDWLTTALTKISGDAESSERWRDRDLDEEADRPAKLPRLDLPTFSGNYEDWDSFVDIFTSLVHNVSRISDTTKLQYLKSCLSGGAAELVKDVPILGVNYASTWKTLTDRFHNPCLTLNKPVDSFLEIPHLKKESANELRAFTDSAQRIVRALTNLGAPAAHYDLWLVHLLEVRLDTESRKLWEAELSAKDQAVVDALNSSGDYFTRMPKFLELAAFLERRTQSLAVINCDKADKKLPAPPKGHPLPRQVHHAQSIRSVKGSECPLCSERHFISQCPSFRANKVYDRQADVRHLRLCFNCLGSHKYQACQSKGRCKTCHEKHHSLLHFNKRQAHPAVSNKEAPSGNSTATPALVNSHRAQMTVEKGLSSYACNPGSKRNVYPILLATAQVIVVGPHGKQIRARVLLDQGSEATFVSDSLAQLLGLERERTHTRVTGVAGCQAGVVKASTRFTLHSHTDSSFKLEVNALILPRLTEALPARSLTQLDITPFKELTLADPEFYRSDRIDIMIGADIYGQLLRPGVKAFSHTLLVAQNTALGWVLSGHAQQCSQSRSTANYKTSVEATYSCATDKLDASIERFWTVEEIPAASSRLKPEDEACEKLFAETYSRDKDGRFVVQLPLKSELPPVSHETRHMALGSLNYLKKGFTRDRPLERAYGDFVNTYIQLGHMELVPPSEVNNPRAWYLPHHPVIQGQGESLKLRVVYDASRRTRDQQCLNDFLMSGPALQGDLALILLNWRRYRYVFSADIVKMFRQIRVVPEHKDLLRILWPPSQPADYRLTTVTYGTTCAPFLAIRTLSQLANDERNRFPLGARCLESNTYVDDAFTGANDLSTAIRKRNELIGILESAGISLDKWAANHTELIPSNLLQTDNGPIKCIDFDRAIKTLGVRWNPASDKFYFTTVTTNTDTRLLTKRLVFSKIASLFDPLGWLAPTTVIAKILMQDLWIAKCDWDEPRPIEFSDRWRDYCDALLAPPTLSIDRWLSSSLNGPVELHGFSDASSRAYAAAVYLRVNEGGGNFRVSLLAAKTKAAPIKTKSIPNLELCGAELLVKLMRYLRRLEFLKNVTVHLWSDSQIVLMWLKKHPCHWRTFVANRVSFIQTELPSATWSHVPTKDNPADLATRGVLPAELKITDLWWHGPTWLASYPQNWPQPKQAVQVLHTRTKSNEPEILLLFSTLTHLIRVTAWCLRPFLQRIRRRAGQGSYPRTLTTAELNNARCQLLKIAQFHAFPVEIELLRSNKALPKSSPLCKIKPFIDHDGIIRVGGRLRNAPLTRDIQHPPVLTRHSALSRLFVAYAHYRALHGGPTLTMSILLRFVWILGMRALVKSFVHKCVTCQRHKPRLAHQLMGDPAAARLTPARPFTTTGLDYAGPIQLRTSKGRGQRAYKGYIALFVCFATKAIHLEVVSDLTSASFIAAFRRFVSRRGLCKQLYSDNATTFHGADAELRAMFRAASDFYSSTASILANDGTSWTFIPPTTPHYGGLWEAGVKSTKHLLKRAIGEHKLTFEELSTVLAEIESCLNSHPLCPLTSHPEDLQALTPAHFLIGAASGVIPDEASPSVPENRLTRFQLMQRIRDQFWKRWTSEYVVQLQERGKWRDPTANFTIGQLVLLKDDRYPTSKWPLGRVIEAHTGSDGLVRVVTVKTASSTLRRHIACLAPLQLDQSEDVRAPVKRG